MLNEFIKYEVFHLHVVWRQVAVIVLVKVKPPHIQGIQAAFVSYGLNDLFCDKHSLRTTKTTKGRIGYRVGLTSVGPDPHGRVKIGVVCVKHRPIVHWIGQVVRTAAARSHVNVNAGYPPILVVADFPVTVKVVPFARHDHVEVPVQPAFHGLSGFGGSQSGEHRPLGSLRFLAAESAPHSPHLYGHGVIRQAQYLCRSVLNFRRVLGGGINVHPTVFLWDR